jgi:hypothetical protein
MEFDSLKVERNGDGAILVRVRSDLKNGRRLPDAVFSFRRGDPQYEFWARKFREQEASRI